MIESLFQRNAEHVADAGRLRALRIKRERSRVVRGDMTNTKPPSPSRSKGKDSSHDTESEDQ
ncbi:hypothetical protein RRF57_008251 [Xylaria bambusicola]|uniref:Uncharacterized protein n=1 Tax=Xylaria bambusicola TaxID=326684 RepID=A0AAN7Z6W3_9PEZI